MKLFITFLILFTFFAHSEDNKPKETQYLKEIKNECDQVLEFAKKHDNEVLKKIHQRHCKEISLRTPSELVVALYHSEVDATHLDFATRKFYKEKIIKLDLLSKNTIDILAPKPVADLSSAVEELSATALDKKRGLIWSLGDSGTGPKIGKTKIGDWSSKGLDVRGATNKDWEAMVVDNNHHIWILDCGDNKKKRNHITLYEIDPEKIEGKNVFVHRTIEVVYQSGARDVEAAVYHSGKIYLIEKSYFQKSKIAVVDIGVNAALKQKISDLSFLPPWYTITDAVIEDENSLVVLTYSGVYRYKNWKANPTGEPETLLNEVWGQTESITSLKSGEFFVGREDGKIFSLKTPSSGQL